MTAQLAEMQVTPDPSNAFETQWVWPTLAHIVDIALSGGSPRPIRVQEICAALGADDSGGAAMVKRSLRYLGEKRMIDVAITSGDGDPNYLMTVRGPTALGIDHVIERRATLTEIDEQVLRFVSELEARNSGQKPSTNDLAKALTPSPQKVGTYAESIRRLVGAGLLEGNDVTSHSSSYTEYMGLRLTLAGIDRLERLPSAAPMTASTVVNIYGGSTVGQVNLGQVMGNIQTSINAVSGPTADEFKRAFQQLLAVIQNDPDLSGVARSEVLEHLEYVAEASAEPSSKRRASVLDAVLAKVPVVVAAAEASAKAWDAFGPELTRFLHR